MEKTKLVAMILAALMAIPAAAQVFDGDPTPKAPRKKTALFNGKNYKGWDIQVNPRGLEGSADEVFGVKDGAIEYRNIFIEPIRKN